MQRAAIQISFQALGTWNQIQVYDPVKNDTLQKAAGRVLEIDQKMSPFRSDSELSIFNCRAGHGFQPVSEDLFYLLNKASEISQASEGAFDCTLRPVIELWRLSRKQNKVPAMEEIRKALRLVNYKSLVFDYHRRAAALRHRVLSIDLGGIAKGFAADEVKRILQENNVRSALINLGGNIIVMGSKPDGSPWRIGIQNPLDVRGKFIGTLPVREKTVVTSGSNEQFFIQDGVRYHHILNPRTGMPAQKNLLGVTVIGESSVYADALTTAFFVLGPEPGVCLLKRFGFQAVWITEDCDVYSTFSLSDTEL